MKKVVLITILVLIIDQISKFYVKTHFFLGEDVDVLGWFKIAFVENPGMAYGMHFGGETGKILLSLLRIVLIGMIIYYINAWAKKLNNNFFIIPIALVLAGAIGNVIDGIFYGVIFDKGTTYNDMFQDWVGYQGVAQANFAGYSSWFTGCVVDMLYFPIVEFDWPTWIPIIGGQHYKFFQPVFNIADSAIFIGGLSLFLFRKKAFTTDNGVRLRF
ncbi:lipoprotein signal peptidase [Empedobacter falsenii]